MAKFSQAFLQSLGNPTYSQGLFDIGKNIAQTPLIVKQERERKAQQAEAMQFLEANKNNAPLLNAQGLKYAAQGNKELAKVFSDAAGLAVTSKTEREGKAQGRGAGELIALANNPAFNFADQKQQTGFFGLADAFGVSREDAAKIALEGKKTREGGRITSSRSGGQYRDEDQNIYEASIVRSSAGEQVRYLPISPDAPEEPVGKLTFVGGSYGETATERTARGVTEAGSEKTAENWSDLKSEAVDSLPRIERSIADVDESLVLLEEISSGGWGPAVIRSIQQTLGVTPENEGQFNLLAGQAVLDGLANFKGAISEGERMYLERLYQSLQKSEGANRGVLLQMQQTFKAALRDAQLRANSASEEEYLRKRGSLETEAPAKKANKKVSFEELITGG